MNANEVLEKLLPRFEVYYAVTRENAAAPFNAEAFFTAKDVQSAVFRNVKISEVDSGEYIFFAAVPELTLEDARRFDEAAWNEGISRVVPGPSHRNTDVGLVLIADRVSSDVFPYFKKLRRHKSYNHMFHGFSNYRAIVLETSSGHMTANRLGQDLKKLFDNIEIIV